MRHYIGLDLGQRHDYTAIVVLGVEERQPDTQVYSNGERPREQPPTYRVPFIDRFRDVPYPQVVERVAAFVNQPELVHRERRQIDIWDPATERTPWRETLPHLLVDSTGVGVAVTDQLRAAGLRFTAITFTGGDTVNRVQGGYRVPVRDLVAVPNVLFDSGRLKLPDVPHRATLVREMQNFTVKINPQTAHDSYGAWRENEHDDLVYGLSMAAWMAEQHHGWHQAIWSTEGVLSL